MNGEAAFQRVGALAAVQGGGRICATLGERRVAVLYVDGTLLAFQARCPHAKGPIHEGEISGGRITCPWHGYEFDLRTGACDEDPSLTLQRFEVRIDGDDILVNVDQPG